MLIDRESRGLRGLASPLRSARRCATFIVNRPRTSCCRRFSSVRGRSLGCKFKERRPWLLGFRFPRDETALLCWLAALLLLPVEELVAVEERHETILERRLEARLLTREDLPDAEGWTTLGVCDTSWWSPHLEDTPSSVRPEEDDDDDDKSDL